MLRGAKELLQRSAGGVLDATAGPLNWRLGEGIRRMLALPCKMRAHPPVGSAAPGPNTACAGLPRVAAVLDEFSRICLEPECELVLPGPDEFASVLGSAPPDLLLVESAWNGNRGAWRSRVESSLRGFDRDLARLVDWCHRHGIPTVFWNKDDPVHFGRFSYSASWFGRVYTTDADCLPAYRRRLHHHRVHTLPFAAQPAVHHPMRDGPRAARACFAGSAWSARYTRRRRDLDVLLRPALDRGLDIYDRNWNVRGVKALKWRYPERYRSAIRGGLAYRDMIRAYRGYRVFLNVNSVMHSPTMFSRRVFELLACGTPVISTWSRGIAELLGEDAVLFSASEQETRDHLEALLAGGAGWHRRSLLGLRKVMGRHTYRERLAEICSHLGLAYPGAGRARLSVFSPVASRADLDWLEDAVMRQEEPPVSLAVLAAPGLRAAVVEEVCSGLGVERLAVLQAPPGADPKSVVAGLGELPGDWWCAMLPGNHYGSRYLADLALATRWVTVDVMGKRSCLHPDPAGGLVLAEPGHEHVFCSAVPSATAAVRASALSPERLDQILHGEWLRTEERACASLDYFNFIAAGTRGRVEDGARFEGILVDG